MASGGSDINTSEETFDYICSACAEEGVIKQGSKYCVECKGYCCVDCVFVHTMYPPLKKHSLLDITISQPGDQTIKLTSFPTERCSIHQGKVVDMYCGDHDSVGCSACIAIDHKNCPDIHSVPDDVDHISKDGEFEQTREDLQSMIGRLKPMLQNQEYLENLERSRQSSLLAIAEHRREIDAILDRLEEEAKKEVDSLFEKMKSDLKNATEKVESCFNKLLELDEKMRLSAGNKSQKFVCTKLVSSNITKEQYALYKSEEKLELMSMEMFFSFVANKTPIDCFQEIKTFGNVEIENMSITVPYQVRKSKDIDVRLNDDTKTCRIRGCCLLNDNILIVVDAANKKLKRVDLTEFAVVDYIDIPYDLRGVCRVRYDELVVGCFTDQIIQFVTIGKQMALSRKIKLNHDCYHLAYRNNALYISDWDSSVFLYNTRGDLLHKISTDSNGWKLCRHSGQLVLCDHTDYLFVAGDDCLVFLDRKGKHNTTIRDTAIVESRGVCTDGKGSVFVASATQIMQFLYDGTKVGVIAQGKDDIAAPMSLLFHQKSRSLFVNMLENDKIKMLELE